MPRAYPALRRFAMSTTVRPAVPECRPQSTRASPSFFKIEELYHCSGGGGGSPPLGECYILRPRARGDSNDEAGTVKDAERRPGLNDAAVDDGHPVTSVSDEGP